MTDIDVTTLAVAANVRRLRNQAGVSAQSLADASGVPRNTITNLENARKGNIPLGEVVALAKGLGVSPLALLRDGSGRTDWFTGDTQMAENVAEVGHYINQLASARTLDEQAAALGMLRAAHHVLELLALSQGRKAT